MKLFNFKYECQILINVVTIWSTVCKGHGRWTLADPWSYVCVWLMNHKLWYKRHTSKYYQDVCTEIVLNSRLVNNNIHKRPSNLASMYKNDLSMRTVLVYFFVNCAENPSLKIMVDKSNSLLVKLVQLVYCMSLYTQKLIFCSPNWHLIGSYSLLIFSHMNIHELTYISVVSSC